MWMPDTGFTPEPAESAGVGHDDVVRPLRG